MARIQNTRKSWTKNFINNLVCLKWVLACVKSFGKSPYFLKKRVWWNRKSLYFLDKVCLAKTGNFPFKKNSVPILSKPVFIKNKFSVVTEIWDLNNGDSRVVNPTLPNSDYGWGMALYLVPVGFCSTATTATTNADPCLSGTHTCHVEATCNPYNTNNELMYIVVNYTTVQNSKLYFSRVLHFT